MAQRPWRDRERTLALIRRAQAGDTQAEDVLVRESEALCVSVASRYIERACGRLELEDLIQLARLGLLQAIRRFDPSRDCALSTYAVGWMKQRVTRAIGNSELIRRPIHRQLFSEHIPVLSLDREFVCEDGIGNLLDIIAADTDVEDEAVTAVWITELLSELSEREREAVVMHYVDGLTLAEIGQRIGLSREGARRVVERGVKRLKVRVQDDD